MRPKDWDEAYMALINLLSTVALDSAIPIADAKKALNWIRDHYSSFAPYRMNGATVWPVLVKDSATETELLDAFDKAIAKAEGDWRHRNKVAQ